VGARLLNLSRAIPPPSGGEIAESQPCNSSAKWGVQALTHAAQVLFVLEISLFV
jgi:hypothetical protein